MSPHTKDTFTCNVARMFFFIFVYCLNAVIFARSNVIIIIARLPSKIVFYQIFLLLALQLSYNISIHLFSTTGSQCFGSQCSEKRKTGSVKKGFHLLSLGTIIIFPLLRDVRFFLYKYKIYCI